MSLYLFLFLAFSCFATFHYTFTLALRVDFYEKSCPNVEKLVFDVVQSAMKFDPTVPAGLLRMHFHDCFIEVTNIPPKNASPSSIY